MNKKLALFPMTREQAAMVRYSSLLQGYDICHCFVPSFLRHFEGVDVSRRDGGEEVGSAINLYNKTDLAKSETLFIDYDDKLEELSIYKDVICNAKESGMEVVLSDLLAHRINEESLTWPIDAPMAEKPGEDVLYKIRVPVITVFSQGIRTDQFAIELTLRSYFTNIGYKVSQIGSIDASRFFGFNSIPSFMYEPRDAYEKILRFNYYVRSLVNQEKPELLIIGVPGATMGYSDQLLQGLGLLPFMVSTAVRADLSILSMYYAKYNVPFFDEMTKHFRYKLSCPASFFSISSVGVMPDPGSERFKLTYFEADSNHVLHSINSEIEHGEYNLFNALNSDSINAMCVAAQKALSDNPRFM